MLSFEIGQRESGLYSGRTDRRTNPPSTVLVYRLKIDFVPKKDMFKLGIDILINNHRFKIYLLC